MKGYVMGKTTFADESFVTALEEFCSSLLSLNTKVWLVSSYYRGR